MATFDYLSLTSKQGILAENGGVWTCLGFGFDPCIQSTENGAYGPIKTKAMPGIDRNASTMYLTATINLSDDQFKGATSMPFTISLNAQAMAQDGLPDPITLQSSVGGIPYIFPESVQYNAMSPVSATQSGSFGSPAQIKLSINAFTSNFNGATVTLAISDLTFLIHDVVYGVTSVAGSSSPLTSSTSSSSSISNPGSTSTSSINNRTPVSRSTLFTTTISGDATVIQNLPSQSAQTLESQSHLPSPSGSPRSSSMNANKRAIVIAGSLVGVGVVFVAISFCYRRWLRRRMTLSGKAPHGDGEIEAHAHSRIVNQEPWVPRPFHKRPYSSAIEDVINPPIEDERAEPWVPRPYRKRPYSRMVSEIAIVPSVEDQRVEPVGLGGQEAVLSSRTRSEGAPSDRLNLPPPAYSQITR